MPVRLQSIAVSVLHGGLESELESCACVSVCAWEGLPASTVGYVALVKRICFRPLDGFVQDQHNIFNGGTVDISLILMPRS